MAKVTFNVNGTGSSGTIQYYTVPSSGEYEFVVRGAAGYTGSLKNSSSGTTYSPTPGKGAVVTGRMHLNEGDELLIVVGQRGTSSVSAVTDGSGGGSGGATWVFRKVSSISDSTYQITINGVSGYWECLYCAAGGCGTIDGAYRKANTTAENASDTVYSLSSYGTYRAFSTSTASPSSSNSQANVVLSLNQIKTYGFNGCYYSRNSNYGYGGFGGGHAADDDRSAGGGWALSDTSYRAASWAAYGGTATVYSSLAQGQLTIEQLDSIPPELNVSYPQEGAIITETSVIVTGTTSDASGIQSVTVNGSSATISGNTFSKEISLAVGQNTIIVISTDTYGNTATKTLTVTMTPDVVPPDVHITYPENGYTTHYKNIEVRGTAEDEYGIESVKLNGNDVDYDSSTGTFQKTLSFPIGVTPVTAWAKDNSGNTNSETILVNRTSYTPEELHPDRPQPTTIVTFSSIVLTPNPVDASTAFTITAVISQEYVYPSIDPLFEFPMDLDYTGLPVSELVFQ